MVSNNCSEDLHIFATLKEAESYADFSELEANDHNHRFGLPEDVKFEVYPVLHQAEVCYTTTVNDFDEFVHVYNGKEFSSFEEMVESIGPDDADWGSIE